MKGRSSFSLKSVPSYSRSDREIGAFLLNAFPPLFRTFTLTRSIDRNVELQTPLSLIDYIGRAMYYKNNKIHDTAARHPTHFLSHCATVIKKLAVLFASCSTEYNRRIVNNSNNSNSILILDIDTHTYARILITRA